MYTVVIWVSTPYSAYRCFGGIYRLHLQNVREGENVARLCITGWDGISLLTTGLEGGWALSGPIGTKHPTLSALPTFSLTRLWVDIPSRSVYVTFADPELNQNLEMEAACLATVDIHLWVYTMSHTVDYMKGAHIVVFSVVGYVMLGLVRPLDIYVGSLWAPNVMSFYWVESTPQWKS